MAIQMTFAPQMSGVRGISNWAVPGSANVNESAAPSDSFVSSDAPDAFLSFKPYRNGAATIAYGGDSPKPGSRISNVGAPAVDLDP